MTEILSLKNISLMIHVGGILKNHSDCDTFLLNLSMENLRLLHEVNALYPQAFEFSSNPEGILVTVNEGAKALIDLITVNASALEAAMNQISSPDILDLF